MNGNSFTALILSVAIGSMTISCGGLRSSNDNSNGATNANAANTNSSNASTAANDNLEDLRSLIRLPFESDKVDEVAWREIPGGPSGKRLVAVILLLPADAKAFAARIQKAGAANSVTVNVERWFPAELVVMSETTGEPSIAGNAYAASEFTQDPYNTGTVTFIPETDYIVVELQDR